jgi:long-chain acyl-CoA synthetase
MGAAATSPSLLTQLRATLPDTRIFITYGMTEASRVCYGEVSDADSYVGSVGRPYPGTQISVVDETGNGVPAGGRGRVMVKSAMVMQGYWNQPVLTEEMFSTDGWLRSPDYAWLDESGSLFLAGRIDNLITSGGEKIAPAEVETVLLGHPAIADAAVVEAPDPNGVMNEVVKAYIVVREGETLDQETVKNYCAQQLESSKVPRIVEFCEALPKTVLGKTATGLLAREGG